MRYSIDILKQKLSGSIEPAKDNVHSNGTFAWSFNGIECKYCMLPIDEMEVDESYQRDIKSKKKIENISLNFNPIECGVLLTGRRDNKYFIVDGQHRYLGAKIRGDITELPCVVFESVSAAEEARLFNKCNSTRSNANPYEKFKAMIVAGDEKYVRCAEILDECEYSWRSRNSKVNMPRFASFATLITYYDVYGDESLKQALTILKPTVVSGSVNNATFISFWGLFAKYNVPDYEALKEQVEMKSSAVWDSFIQSMVTEANNLKPRTAFKNTLRNRTIETGTVVLADYLNTKLRGKSKKLTLKEETQ